MTKNELHKEITKYGTFLKARGDELYLYSLYRRHKKREDILAAIKEFIEIQYNLNPDELFDEELDSNL